MNIANNQQTIDKNNTLTFYMNYLGYTYEDGIVISESFTKRMNYQIGNKMINSIGRKGVISLILSDNEMPYRNSDGRIADVLENPIAIINSAILKERCRNECLKVGDMELLSTLTCCL
jgi:DNA-directed RNA polymerase beta subunit